MEEKKKKSHTTSNTSGAETHICKPNTEKHKGKQAECVLLKRLTRL